MISFGHVVFSRHSCHIFIAQVHCICQLVLKPTKFFLFIFLERTIQEKREENQIFEVGAQLQGTTSGYYALRGPNYTVPIVPDELNLEAIAGLSKKKKPYLNFVFKQGMLTNEAQSTIEKHLPFYSLNCDVNFESRQNDEMNKSSDDHDGRLFYIIPNNSFYYIAGNVKEQY